MLPLKFPYISSASQIFFLLLFLLPYIYFSRLMSCVLWCLRSWRERMRTRVGAVPAASNMTKPKFFDMTFSNSHWVSSAADDKVEGDLPAVENTPEFNKDPVMTPKPVRALICGEKGESSVVKYKITATPGYICISLTNVSFRYKRMQSCQYSLTAVFRVFICFCFFGGQCQTVKDDSIVNIMRRAQSTWKQATNVNAYFLCVREKPVLVLCFLCFWPIWIVAKY